MTKQNYQMVINHWTAASNPSNQVHLFHQSINYWKLINCEKVTVLLNQATAYLQMSQTAIYSLLNLQFQLGKYIFLILLAS